MTPGDRCRITVPISGVLTTFDAVVHLVGADGRPLGFLFEGMIEGFVGWLPVIWGGSQAHTFAGTVVEIDEGEAS